MAERLTEKIRNDLYIGKQCDDCLESIEYCGECSYVQSIKNKLGKLEDILEKYGVDVEKLNQMLEWLFTLSGQDADDMKFIARDRKLIHQQYCDIKTDRDTWKRACELASETLKQVMGKPLWIGGNIPTPEVKDSDYFYQQAKKEKEEQNNDTNQ